MVANLRPKRINPSTRVIHVLAWSLGCFLLGQLVAGVILDHLLPHVRFPDFYQTLNKLATCRPSPQIVCCGSSRLGTGLHAGEMTRVLREAACDAEVVAYNASVPAGDFLTTRRMLEAMLKEGVVPRILVLEICPDVVNERMVWLGYHVVRTLRLEDFPAYASDLAKTRFLDRFLLTRLLALFHYRGAIRSEMRATLMPQPMPNSEGRRPWTNAKTLTSLDASAHKWRSDVKVNEDLRQDPKRFSIPKELTRMFRAFHVGGHPVDELRRILTLCQANAIRPILVEVPVSECHRQLYTDFDSEYRNFVESVRAEFGCEVVDYRTLVPDSEFVDHHHCAHEGCLRFTRTLTTEVLVREWQRFRSRENEEFN